MTDMHEQAAQDFYAFPVLYDVSTVQGGKVVKSKKGFYDYERNIFVLPKKVFEKIKESHPLDYDVINMVGYEIKK